MNTKVDLVEPRADWLMQATCKVLALGGRTSLRPGAEGFALQLLRSIEADDLPTPDVSATRRGSVLVAWEKGGRALHLRVGHPSRCVVRRFVGVGWTHPRVIRRDHVEAIRTCVAWLDPAANRIFADVYKRKFQGG